MMIKELINITSFQLLQQYRFKLCYFEKLHLKHNPHHNEQELEDESIEKMRQEINYSQENNLFMLSRFLVS